MHHSQFDGLNFFVGTVGEVGDSLVFYLSVFSIGLSEKVVNVFSVRHVSTYIMAINIIFFCLRLLYSQGVQLSYTKKCVGTSNLKHMDILYNIKTYKNQPGLRLCTH